MTLAPGVRLGAYEVLALIGRGGMGACGHAGVPSAAAALGWRAEGISVSSRRGWGPAASEKMLTQSPCR